MAARKVSTTRGLAYDPICDAVELAHGTTIVASYTASGLSVDTLTVNCTANLPAGGVGAADIEDDSLNGDQVANHADGNSEGGIALLYSQAYAPTCCTTCDISITFTDKVRIVDVWTDVDCVDACETLTLQDACCNAVSTALSLACAGIVRTVVLGNNTIAACGTLTGAFSAGTDTAAGTLFVLAHKIA